MFSIYLVWSGKQYGEDNNCTSFWFVNQWYKGSLQFTTSCLATLKVTTDSQMVLAAWFHSSDDWPLPPTVTHFKLSAADLHLQLFATSHGHMIAIYDIFAKNQGLLPVWGKKVP